MKSSAEVIFKGLAFIAALCFFLFFVMGITQAILRGDYQPGTCIRDPNAVGRGDDFYPPELIVETLDEKYITCRANVDKNVWLRCGLSSKRVLNDLDYYVPVTCPEYELVDFEWKKK
jgi:hypothetical protein